MKKLFSLLAVVCLSMSALAKNDVSTVSGQPSLLNDPSVRMTLSWDYSECKIEGKSVDAFLKSKGDDWVRDYPGEIAAAEASFSAFYNKKTKSAVITDDADEADYNVVIKVTEFDYGSTGASVAMSLAFGGFARKAGGASFTGDIYVYKNGEKVSPIAVMHIDNFIGDGDISNTARRTNAYFQFAKEFVKYLKKQK